MSLKGVGKLQRVDDTVRLWMRSVQGALHEKHPDLIKLLLGEVPVMPDDAPPARVAAREALDKRSADLLLSAIATDLAMNYEHIVSGRELWQQLEQELHAYSAAMGSTKQTELFNVGPVAGEGVVLYFDRAVRLNRGLHPLGRGMTEASLIDIILRGLERERPSWSTTCETIKANTSTLTMIQLKAHLGNLEAQNPSLAATDQPAAHAFAASAQQPNVPDIVALAAGVKELTAKFDNFSNKAGSNQARARNGRRSLLCVLHR